MLTRELVKVWMNFKILCQKCVRTLENKGQLNHILRNNNLRSNRCELLFEGLHFFVNCIKLHSMCLNKYIKDKGDLLIKEKSHSLNYNIRTSTTYLTGKSSLTKLCNSELRNLKSEH
jgi:hypothetical protein